MPRATQTDLAVLAALSIEPMTGYALRDAIRVHLGAFWSESFGQIYPTLARLRETGLVAVDHGHRTGSSLHSLTPVGRAHLIELMREAPVSTPPRNGVLLRLFFGSVLGAAACGQLVADARQQAVELLDALATARSDAEAEPHDLPHRPYVLMTISAGEHSARAAITWADNTLEALDALARAEDHSESARPVPR